MAIVKFTAFPKAYPHFREDDLISKLRESRVPPKTPQEAKRRFLLREKVKNSEIYYDLLAFRARGIPTTVLSYERFLNGFTTLNTDSFRDSKSQNFFGDMESRWFGMSRKQAREIILDEAFLSREEGVASIPTPQEGESSAAQGGGAQGLLIFGGILVLAVGVGYGAYALTLRDANQ